jgi:hypothetical protein
MTRFTTHNTTGYTAEQLTELNRRYQAAIAARAPDPQDMNYKSTCDHIAERVQAKFDIAEQDPRYPSNDD